MISRAAGTSLRPARHGDKREFRRADVTRFRPHVALRISIAEQCRMEPYQPICVPIFRQNGWYEVLILSKKLKIDCIVQVVTGCNRDVGYNARSTENCTSILVRKEFHSIQ